MKTILAMILVMGLAMGAWAQSWTNKPGGTNAPGDPDPIWNHAPALGIKQGDIDAWNRNVGTNATSAISRVTNTDTSRWTEAWGWGDHATNGYLTAVNTQGLLSAESDPIFGNSSNDIAIHGSQGKTAYGWGDHGTNGYLGPVWTNLADIVIGRNAKSGTSGGISIGDNARGNGASPVAIGKDTVSTNYGNVAIGYAAKALGSSYSVQIGDGSNTNANSLKFRSTVVVNSDGSLAESDPVFTNWNATNTNVKVETDPIFTNWNATNTNVKVETDPIFTNWNATNTNVKVETDPIFTNWNATNTNVKVETDFIFTNWNATNTNVKVETDSIFTNWNATNTNVKVETDSIFTNWRATNIFTETFQQVLDKGNVATNLIYAGGYQGPSNAFDVGSATSPAQHVYVGTNSLYVGTNRFSATASGQPLWNGSLTFLDGIARGQTSNNTASLAIASQRIWFLERNLLLTWVELEIQNHLTRVALADGYKDYFYDQAGINLTASSNQTWNSAGYYSWARTTTGTPGSVPYVQWKLNDNAASAAVLDNFEHQDLAAVTVNSADLHSDTKKVGTGSFYFQGGSSYRVKSASWKGPAAGTSFSVLLWIKTESTASADAFLSWGDNTAGAWMSCYLNANAVNGDYLIWHNGGPSALANGQNVTDGNWHQIAFTYDDSTHDVHSYVDGAHATSPGNNGMYASNNYTVANAGNYDVALGYRIRYGDSDLTGYLDDVRIYTNVLSPTEIASMYAAESEDITEVGTTGGGNMAIVATNTTATILPFDPVDARLGLWIKTNSGEVVMNTDLKGYVSCDNGTNFDEVTFTDSTRYSTNANDVIWWGAPTNLTGTGSNMLWKVQTLNTNTAGRIYGAFLQAK